MIGALWRCKHEQDGGGVVFADGAVGKRCWQSVARSMKANSESRSKL